MTARVLPAVLRATAVACVIGGIWFAAVAAPAPDRPKPGPGQEASWLSDRDWVSATNGWGPVERDTSNGENAAGDGFPIRLNGRVYEKGLGVVPTSVVTYDLGGRCTRFLATVGVDDSVDDRGSGGSVVFSVLADGRTVFDSGVRYGTQWSESVLDVDTEPLDVDLDVTGVDRLQLRVDTWYDGITNDHADWAAARVFCRAG